ncbi:MAG: ABC transporter ATP-binding protein [Dissulfurispiraceae bacterium]
MSTKEGMLEVRDLAVQYGAISAVKGISFGVHAGEIVTLIGANGAGKTSALNAISGTVSYTGTIFYKGQNLRGVPPHRIVAMGIAHVPEGRGIFGNLTVMENLRIATWQRKDKAGVRNDFQRVFEFFPRLKERVNQPGGTLSGGEQQMLAVARALMSNGTMLVLDEPSMGLSPLMVQEIMNILSRINKEGTTILLVEQNANMALHIASRGYVLETGIITLSGTGQELRGNPLVREAYLG